MYVCVCNGVTDKQIRQACDEGVTTFSGLQKQLKVATCCGRCRDCANSLVEEHLAQQLPLLSAAPA